MNQRRVRFTATARAQVTREKRWWLENRIHTEILATELEEALRIVAFLPGAGTSYPDAGVAGLRRIYLRTATARKLAVLVYRTLKDHLVYVAPGAAAYDAQDRTRVVRRLRLRAENLGFGLVNLSTGEVVEGAVS